MKTVRWVNLSFSDRKSFLARPTQENRPALRTQVAEIIQSVQARGDVKIREYTEKFDKCSLTDFKVSAEEISQAAQSLSITAMGALKRAASQIETFHKAQISEAIRVETSPGVLCFRENRPIDSVGLYIPGGTAPLPSTVLMLGIPAKIAGCPRKVLCSPPNKKGIIDPAILAAASLCGIEEIYKIGGAQAIAAMAYGTETLPKVDKIFGPGNSWVTEAKLQVSQDPLGAAADLPAGPSEVLVIADETADAAFVAADLLSQAEHGEDSQVVLVSTCSELIEKVKVEIENQIQSLSRKDIARSSLEKSLMIEAANISEAIEISNRYAPEHLILQVENAKSLIPQIRNAGSVFLGPWSPEAIGDYASGTNHVLPTYGFAKAHSGVSLASFVKQITFQEITPEGMLDIGPVVEILADMEGLTAHKNAVQTRLKRLRDS